MGKELLKELIDKGVITLDDIDNYLESINKNIIDQSQLDYYENMSRNHPG